MAYTSPGCKAWERHPTQHPSPARVAYKYNCKNSEPQRGLLKPATIHCPLKIDKVFQSAIIYRRYIIVKYTWICYAVCVCRISLGTQKCIPASEPLMRQHNLVAGPPGQRFQAEPGIENFEKMQRTVKIEKENLIYCCLTLVARTLY